MAPHASCTLAALAAVGIFSATAVSALAADLPSAANASPSHLEITAGRAHWVHFGVDILVDSARAITLSTSGGFPGDRPHISLPDGSLWGVPASDSKSIVVRNGSVELEDISGGFHLELDLGADFTYWGNCEGTLGITVNHGGVRDLMSGVPLNVTVAVRAPRDGSGPTWQMSCTAASRPASPVDGGAVFLQAAAVKGAGAFAIIAARRGKKRGP